jgi:hypothetical protein
MNAMPENVTPHGAIAYRIEAVANGLSARSDADDEARTLWGIMDDLVALNLAEATGEIERAEVIAAALEWVRADMETSTYMERCGANYNLRLTVRALNRVTP